MAVFLINICKFNGCERIFPSLNDLIHHIENTHIDESQAPDVTEKTQPTCLPLSYVLRFVTDESRRDGAVALPVAPAAASSTNGTDKAKLAVGGNGLRLSGAAPAPSPSSINQTAASDHHGTITTTTLHGVTATNHSISVANGGNGNSNNSGSVGAMANGVATPNGGCIADQQQNGIGTVVSSAVGSGGLESAKAAHLNQTVGTTDLKRKIAIKHHSYSISATNRSITPTGSEMDDDEMMVSESEDSNDSWTTEEFSSEFIMRYGSRRHSASGGGSGNNSTNEKPFACPVPGCKKRYKNVNGIKYHSKNGHKKDGNRVRKAFKCYCGKSYKTTQRLKNHNMLVHAVAQNGGSPIDGPLISSTSLATIPLASPAALISPPVKSPSLNNGPIGGQSNSNPGTNISNLPSTSLAGSGSSSSSIVAAAAAAIASSQIGTNATPTNATCTTSPSTLTITQVTTHKVPRALVLAANSVGTGGAVTGATTNNNPLSVSGTNPSSVVYPVSTTTSTSAGVSPVSIKYDNLGILTPATSPKLIAATLCQEGGNQPQPAPPPPPPTVVTTTSSPAGSNTVLGGISLKTTVQGSGAGNVNGGTGELVGSGNGVGGNVGIALVVSASSAAVGNGSESKLAGGGNGHNKNAVLSASVTAGQLFAEET
uniref:C2H2-type domain-containing protein n=1 Tax=Anopheles christyi TaxID=43041 RepID=A0A182K577_9DIPT